MESMKVKDYCVITYHEFLRAKDGEIAEWDSYTHVYGPYEKKEALRMAKQLKNAHTFTTARKILDRNEVTARPHTPRG